MLLVHLASADRLSRLRRNGIAMTSVSGAPVARGVFAMPVLPSYYASHQWVRELRRRHRDLVAVYFRVPDGEPVLVGHYNSSKYSCTAAESAAVIRSATDPRGYEVVLPRRVGAGEIHRIQAVSRVVGWRYYPDANGRSPCACPACAKGEFGARAWRTRISARDGDDYWSARPTRGALLRSLHETDDAAMLADALLELSSRRGVRTADVRFLADHPSPDVREALAIVLGRCRDRQASRILAELAEDADDAVRAAARSRP